MELYEKIKAILFFKGEPLSVDTLAKILEVSHGAIGDGINALHENLHESGLRIVEANKKIELRAAPEMSEIIEKIVKEDLEKDIGKAGLETLSVVLYRSPVTRAQVDYIRGVNSSYMLRHLMVRGLIERIPNPNDSRSYVYRPTHELLGHLGIENLQALPEYETVQEEIKTFEQSEEEKE